MTPAKKPSGLRDEDPKRSLDDFQYLFKYLSPEPTFSHVGWVFALQFPNGNLTFIHGKEERSYQFAHMKDLARMLNAKLVTVKGTWHWTPEVEVEIELIDDEEGPVGNE